MNDIYTAIVNQDLSTVKQWLASGGDPNEELPEDTTYLLMALETTNRTLIELLVRHGAEVERWPVFETYYVCVYGKLLDEVEIPLADFTAIVDLLMKHGAYLSMETAIDLPHDYFAVLVPYADEDDLRDALYLLEIAHQEADASKCQLLREAIRKATV